VSNVHVLRRVCGAAAAAVALTAVLPAGARRVVRASGSHVSGSHSFHIESFAPSDQRHFSPAQLAVLEKLNRRDLEHLARLDRVIAPESWANDELEYSPLPDTWAWAEAVPKALVVHQPSQVFGAYESGRLVRWGPVSTGRKESPTPDGLFHLTWRAKSRRSTENDEWLLKWYFNFVNERGVSFHQFELPGRPASHACVRLLARDAKWIYDWGEQWQLNPDKHHVDRLGTPVLILGTYDFAQPAPWLTLEWWQTPIELPTNPA
jgi:hypothetical protein